ncbi:MFS transporter [Paenibacillus sp. 481]|nr:MFS transporter [Paenibacillus sp. 481]
MHNDSIRRPNDNLSRKWMMYDWANSGFSTTMMAAVLPIFYLSVAGAHLEGAQASGYWAYTQTIAMLIVAICAPVSGAIADLSQRKMTFLRTFAWAGATASALMMFAGEGDWLYVSALYVIAILGFSGGNTFYDSLLPDIASPEQRDDVSAKGYMFGYIGGGILLAINIVMMEMWEPLGFANKLVATQFVFLSVGIWWFVFSLPLFRAMRDPKQVVKRPLPYYAKYGFTRVFQTVRKVKQYPELLKYMVAFWFFNDGISTIIGMSAIYGAEIGIQTTHLIVALLITQFVGIPFTFLFGKFAHRIGSKRSLYVSLSIYAVIVCVGYFMETALHFYILAFMVGIVQGGSQAVARSIYSQMVPRSRAAEFFGFLSLSSKMSAAVGPAVFGTVSLLTGSTRVAILSILAFFIIGIVLLTFVNIEKGKREAELEDTRG